MLGLLPKPRIFLFGCPKPGGQLVNLSDPPEALRGFITYLPL